MYDEQEELIATTLAFVDIELGNGACEEPCRDCDDFKTCQDCLRHHLVAAAKAYRE